MFRNPRENKDLPASAKLAHSIGRAPSPPSDTASTTIARTVAVKPTPPSTMASNTSTKTQTSRSPAASAKPGVRKKSTPTTAKTSAKPNGLITNFFQRTESQDEGLFWGVKSHSPATSALQQDEISWVNTSFEDEDRYHENESPVKRRKTSASASGEESTDKVDTPTTCPTSVTSEPLAPVQEAEADCGDHPATLKSRTQGKRGPFLDDSDSEGDDETSVEVSEVKVKEPGEQTFVEDEVAEEKAAVTPKPAEVSIDEASNVDSTDTQPAPPADESSSLPRKPPLLRQDTSRFTTNLQDFDDFEDMPDAGEEDEDGEEFNYGRLAAEQRQLEMSDGLFEGEMEADIADLADEDLADTIKQEPLDDDDGGLGCDPDTDETGCPICTVSLGGVSAADAAVHVNNCLDGNPTPLPERIIKTEEKPTIRANAFKLGDRRRIPKPGQENPWNLAPPQLQKGKGSAFSKLMSNHAEDTAWKTAAEHEAASRGKPAFQRTCPFYKIMPGYSICVDAFRYGAVEGCKAYFLSHFHSDHYIGLTSKWCHGPIYCSRVTANLVRQQLGVDPRWVIGLPWEEEVEVPGTNGAKVTMIPANHCPGSSLYLFEKVMGKGDKPKVQRILHCGDFRACKAHVEHPLLRPDVMDAVTGKTREQKIDVCYLDTTYLNPKYAFPSQADVIQACADMCVSLSKEFKNEEDNFERMKRERAGNGMVQFLQEGSSTNVKQDECEPTDNRPAGQARGRLLVVVGTYSIGKERICLGIARALKSKIYAPPGKQRIVRALEDPELQALMTTDPREAQIHMTPLFEIRAETLDDYLKDYRDTFTRAVGFRPSGWNYRPPNSRFIESPSVQTVLYGQNWKSTYSMRDLMPQRGSTKRAACYGVPYSEHSSFRELTMFCCALRIDKVVPTVNVGSARSRERMRAWVDRWAVERKKSGLFKAEDFGGVSNYVDP